MVQKLAAHHAVGVTAGVGVVPAVVGSTPAAMAAGRPVWASLGAVPVTQALRS